MSVHEDESNRQIAFIDHSICKNVDKIVLILQCADILNNGDGGSRGGGGITCLIARSEDCGERPCADFKDRSSNGGVGEGARNVGAGIELGVVQGSAKGDGCGITPDQDGDFFIRYGQGSVDVRERVIGDTAITYGNRVVARFTGSLRGRGECRCNVGRGVTIDESRVSESEWWILES